MKNVWSCALLLVMATAVLAQASAQAPAGQSEDHLRDLANHAKDTGDLQAEANYFCQAAALDGKKYQRKCDKAKADSSKALDQFKADFDMGQNELQQKDYAGAVRDLGKVTFGPNKQQAGLLLKQAQLGMGGPAAQQVSATAFREAREAYMRGDFDTAETQLKLAQEPAQQAAAGQLATNINVYRASMKQADTMAQAGDWKGAAQKYGFAVMIQPKGPGQPEQKQHDAEQKAAELAKNTPPPAPTPVPPPVAQPAPRVNYAAKIKSLLDGSAQAESKGDLKSALSGYQQVLQLDGRRAEALAGKKRVLEAMSDDPKQVEQELAGGIQDFYDAKFDEAEQSLGDYLKVKGIHHEGAAHFYMGAALLSQGWTAAPKAPQADVLRQQAQKEFAEAKGRHYLPVEQMVSPKIVAAWKQAGQ